MNKIQYLVIFTIIVFATAANASVNISPGSSFYEDLDVLVSKGVIESSLSSTKPFTRAEAGRLVAEAITRAGTEESSPCEALLETLSKEYKDEIAEAVEPGSGPGTFIKPLESFSVVYNYLNGPCSVFNNEGIAYYDGHNAMAGFESRGELWNVFSFYVQPVVLYNQRLDNVDGNDDTVVRLQKGYVKFHAGNFEIEAGRDSLWWGPGYHGSLLLSNNARPFDMIKLSNPRGTLLPWILSSLGPFRYNLFLAELDGDPQSGHPPDSKLLGARIDLKPHPLMEFGMSYLAHFGGDRPGIDSLGFSDYVDIILSNECRDGDRRDSNKEFAVDVAVTIPHVDRFLPVAESVKLYAEWGAEDAGYPPDKRAYILGMALYDFFTIDGLTVRAEYADISPESGAGSWYTHSFWPMEYYGNVFGHHAGSDSDDIFLGLSHRLTDCFSYEIGFDRERSGLSLADTQEKHQYFLKAGFKMSELLRFTLRYAYETIDNYENIKDQRQRNHFLGTEITWDF